MAMKPKTVVFLPPGPGNFRKFYQQPLREPPPFFDQAHAEDHLPEYHIPFSEYPIHIEPEKKR